MANLEQVRRKPVKVVLADGIEREIRFTLNTLADLEDKYGDADEALNLVSKGKIKDIRFMLWALLRGDDDSLTERQVGNLIDMDKLGAIMEAIQKASSSDLIQDSDIQKITPVASADPN